MIPTLLVLGLLLAAVPTGLRHRRAVLAATLVWLSLAWGFVVSDGAPSTTPLAASVAAGAALAAANLLVGGAVGAGVRVAHRLVGRRDPVPAPA